MTITTHADTIAKAFISNAKASIKTQDVITDMVADLISNNTTNPVKGFITDHTLVEVGTIISATKDKGTRDNALSALRVQMNRALKDLEIESVTISFKQSTKTKPYRVEFKIKEEKPEPSLDDKMAELIAQYGIEEVTGALWRTEAYKDYIV